MSGAYSFLDVAVVIDGPGGNFSIKDGSAQEGVTIDPVSDQSTMTEGADGSVMHSLSAGSACTVTVRLLKTSPVNKQLMELFKHQTSSAARHGRNTITVRDAARGDLVTVTQAAIKRPAALTYATDGGVNEWVFDGGKTDYVLGDGAAEAQV